MKKFVCTWVLSVLFFTLFAQIPAGYYLDAVGKKGAELKTALHGIIKNADVLDYGSGDGATWSGFARTDRRPDGTVWDMYSNERRQFNGNSAPAGMNIEHSFAKSWWGGTKNQAYKDLHHLNPSDSKANSARGSWPLGIVTGKESYNNGVIKVGKCNLRPGGEITVWEPADEYKGDFARAYMYMVTAYQDFQWQGNSEPQLDNNIYPVFEDWALNLLLEWTRQDPVSEKEINRNREIYAIQGNRNPYIDFPDMAEYVWGRLKDVPFTEDGNIDIPYLQEPLAGSDVDFGRQAYLQSAHKTLHVKAFNLTGDLAVTISGADAALFAAQPTIRQADAEAGYDLQIVFTASEVGEKKAELTLSGGGVSAVKVGLTAFATDDFMSLPATNVTATGFTANWTVSAGATGYELNVYTLQNSDAAESEVLLESDFMSGLPTGWRTVAGFTAAESEGYRLASGKQNGEVSTAIDLNGYTAVLTVNAKQYSDDAAVLTLKLDGVEKENWTMTGSYADYVAELPSSTSEISLSAKSGKRVYLSSVRVETLGSKPEQVPVDGYPLQVGNVLSHDVTGLLVGTTYYYTVTPVGNGVPASNAVEVFTATQTGLESADDGQVLWHVSGNELSVSGLVSSAVQLFSFTGVPVYSASDLSGELRVTLPGQGVYLLRVDGRTYKIMND